MSRIGNKPIEIPEKVEINIDGNKRIKPHAPPLVRVPVYSFEF
jgi:ribosomal protein L6P/L9E